MGTSAYILQAQLERKPRAERRFACFVAVALAAGGLVWVFVTDVLLYALVTDPGVIARIETAKAWLFVGFAATLAFLTTQRLARRMLRARAALTAVVDSIADGVFLLGPDRRIEYANAAAKRMLRSERLVGMTADEFSRRFHMSYSDGSILPPAEYLSQRIFDGEGGPLKRKLVLYPPGAPELVVSATAAAVRDDSGVDPHIVVSVWHDMTATEHSDRVRNEFFAAAAHALKTPIAIIKTSVQSSRPGDAAGFGDSLAAIERQCSRIDRLVQNLLVLARTRTDTLELHHENIELKPAIEQSLREMAAEIAQTFVVGAIEANCRVRADGDRFVLLLRNLLDVASRSTTAQSAIGLTLVRRGEDAEITLDFDARPREERPTAISGDYDEMGIARLVANAIVAAHGWTLHEAQGGPRTTLSLRLPVSSEPAGNDSARHPHRRR